MAIRLVRHEKKEKIYDHALMTNRDLPDQHPIVAISGLKDFLDNMSSEITTISNSISDKIVVGGNENVTVEILDTEWHYDPIKAEHFKFITHNLATEDLIVEFYNADKRNEVVSYQIIDQDSIGVFVDTPQYIKVIINASLGHLSENLRTIKSSDFLDDSSITSTKSWSSSKINTQLLYYPKRTEVYTKAQADVMFASKLKEHMHSNFEVLEGFSTDLANNLYYKGIKIGSNVKPTLKEITWSKKTLAESTLLVDTFEIYKSLNGIFITGSEIILHNAYEPISETVDADRPLVVQIVDSDITIVDVVIKPGETQKYVLGVSPNIKVYAKGYLTGKYYVEALTTVDNLNLYPDIINDLAESTTTTWSSFKTSSAIEEVKDLATKGQRVVFNVMDTTELLCNHNLNTRYVHVSVWVNDEEFLCTKKIIDENNVLVSYPEAFTGVVVIS